MPRITHRKSSVAAVVVCSTLYASLSCKFASICPGAFAVGVISTHDTFSGGYITSSHIPGAMGMRDTSDTSTSHRIAGREVRIGTVIVGNALLASVIVDITTAILASDGTMTVSGTSNTSVGDSITSRC